MDPILERFALREFSFSSVQLSMPLRGGSYRERRGRNGCSCIDFVVLYCHIISQFAFLDLRIMLVISSSFLSQLCSSSSPRLTLSNRSLIPLPLTRPLKLSLSYPRQLDWTKFCGPPSSTVSNGVNLLLMRSGKVASLECHQQYREPIGSKYEVRSHPRSPISSSLRLASSVLHLRIFPTPGSTLYFPRFGELCRFMLASADLHFLLTECFFLSLSSPRLCSGPALSEMSTEGWDSQAPTPTASAAVSRSPTLVDLPSHNNLDSTVKSLSKPADKQSGEVEDPGQSQHPHLPHLNLPPHPHQHLERYYPPENYESLDQIEREKEEARRQETDGLKAGQEKGEEKVAKGEGADDFPDGGLRAWL